MRLRELSRLVTSRKRQAFRVFVVEVFRRVSMRVPICVSRRLYISKLF